jgi:hypothetical protein
MKDKENISSKGPKKRDSACYQVLHDIVIPAGTILRQQHGLAEDFGCVVAGGIFRVGGPTATDKPGTYKRVVA